MKSYDRSRLADQTLAQNLVVRNARLCDEMADHLADVGEFEARRLHLPAGYPSTFKYCVHELHLTDQSAYKRIYVARKARRFPAIFHAIADGRLHLSGVVTIGRHLTEETAVELLAAIEHKTCKQIERIRAERFPQPDLPTVIEPIALHRPTPAVVATGSPADMGLSLRKVQIATPAVAMTPQIEGRPTVTPLAPARVGWQFTTGQDIEDLYCEVRDLLGHDIPPEDVEAVLKYSLLAAKEKLLKQKCAATECPRPGRPRSADSRHIPAEVRRAVWKRDVGQCAFTSQSGQRCTERRDLEFDHIDPYARDGASTIGNVRLLCRAHNQFEAERTYGAELMRHKRKESRSAASSSPPPGTARC